MCESVRMHSPLYTQKITHIYHWYLCFLFDADSDKLYKIQNAVLSYERSIELGKNECELLTEKVKTMENKARGLHKKLSEARAIKSQLEHQKVELEGKLWNLRY